MVTAKLGDIITIPYSGSKSALAQIVWISTHIKNGMGLVIFSVDFKGGDDISTLKALSINIPVGEITTIYANVKNVNDGLWPILGNVEVINLDKYITHNIGGDLYIGDEFLRHLKSEEYKNYQKVLNSGNKAVEIYLNAFYEQNQHSL